MHATQRNATHCAAYTHVCIHMCIFQHIYKYLCIHVLHQASLNMIDSPKFLKSQKSDLAAVSTKSAGMVPPQLGPRPHAPRPVPAGRRQFQRPPGRRPPQLGRRAEEAQDTPHAAHLRAGGWSHGGHLAESPRVQQSEKTPGPKTGRRWVVFVILDYA